MSAGVDFGTYRSVVSRVQNDIPRELPLGAVQGEWDVPSVVFIPSDGSAPLFGSAAQIRAGLLAAQPNSGLVISNLKLDLVDSSRRWAVNSCSLSVDDLFYGMTKHLLELCRERSPGFDPEHSCFTLPCFISLARQEQLRALLKRAGWKTPMFLQEPAAALCGALNHDQGISSGTYLVVDIGHGSCDLGLVEVERSPGELEIRERFFVGNTWFSGEEVDRAFLAGLSEDCEDFTPTDRVKFARMRAQLQPELRKVKESLSFQDVVDLIIPQFPNAARYLDIEVRRAQFEDYLQTARLVECLTNLVNFAREQSGLGNELARIVLTGRSSLLPVVRRTLESKFPDSPTVPPFERPEDAKLVVAHGAALHAAGLVGIRYHRAVRSNLHFAGTKPESPLVRVGEPLPLTLHSALEIRGGSHDLVLLETAPGGDSTELLRHPLPKLIRNSTPDRAFQVEFTLTVTEEGCKLKVA